MKLTDYKILLQNYVAETISTETFTTEYLNAFKSEPEGMDKRLFDILEDLFEDIDSYSPMWTLLDEKDIPYRITEPTLHNEALVALQNLEQYMIDQSKNAA